MRPTHRPALHHSSSGRSPAGARTRLLRPLMAAVLVASAAGCGNAAERVTEADLDAVSEAGSDSDAGEVTYDAGEGITVTEGTSMQMPPEIAAALDVPGGFTVAAVVRADEADGGDDSISVAGTYEGATVEDLAVQLDTALAAAGWQLRDRPDSTNAYAVGGIADRGQETFGYHIISTPDVDPEGPYNLSLTLFPNGL